ncbi:MAG TPA: threonine synthase [Chloroflexota bacterium]|nr:threonine synthase [Chloroflexota bacterium]
MTTGTPGVSVREGLLRAYGDLLPVTGRTPLLSLGEGHTPLIRGHAIEQRTGLRRVFLKLEGCNPTGSFKDRGMVLAVAKAAEEGAQAVICASTGNTSAAAAAYAARAGLRALVVVPAGYVAAGKLAQALAYGARIASIGGNFDQALAVVRELAATGAATLVNHINPHRIEGQQTGAWEICDALGDAPAYVCLPMGNAGNITAYWKGFRRYHELGRSTTLPRMMGFQAEGAAAVVLDRMIEQPITAATAIRIGNPASRAAAIAARAESGGQFATVSEEEIRDAYRFLAAQEGVFVEPASAASVAGLLKLAAAGGLESDGTVVCILTGNGLKDPDYALSLVDELPAIPATVAAVAAAAGLDAPA